MCSSDLGKIKALGLASYAIPVLSVLILILFHKAEFTTNIAIATLAISLAPTIPPIKAALTKIWQLLFKKDVCLEIEQNN